MTTSVAAEPVCPRCAGPMWNQKNGKFPWKPGTPIFKCKTKECATTGGVIWEPKNGAIPPTATPPKSAPAKLPVSHSNVPNEQLPEFLRDADLQDSAELSAKVGVDLGKFSKDLALYTALTEFVTTKIAPLYGNEQGIGMSPESAVAAVATLYIQAKK